MPINMVVADGIVENLSLRYDANGKSECRFTLHQEENGFPLFIPCTAVGQAAERLAGDLEDGMHIVITLGKLCYRKRSTAKLGEVSRMEVLVWSVEKLTTSPQDARSVSGEEEDTGPEGETADHHSANLRNDPEPMPAPKARRRPYPQQARLGGFAIR
jgi:single-stranded DNA-binding protein